MIYIRSVFICLYFFFSSRRRHTIFSRDWSSDVCSSDLAVVTVEMTIAVTGDIVEAKAGKWRLTIDREINDPNYWASKPERAFLDEAEAAARKWKFVPLDTQTTVQVLFSFR